MGRFLGTKIVESRFYENPADPANSDWSIFLPKTAIEAVVGLQSLLDLMENQLQSLQQKFQSLFGFPIAGTVNTFTELPNSAPDGEHLY